MAESISDACDFFRQPGESRLRVLDLAASLFDHVAAECIGDVAALNVAEGSGDAGGVGSLRSSPGFADRGGEDDGQSYDVEEDEENHEGAKGGLVGSVEKCLKRERDTSEVSDSRR